jgi:UPF0755 protein
MKRKFLILLVLLTILPPLAYSYYNYALGLANSSDEAAAKFTIEAGQSVEEIARNLEKEGLIRSAALFQLYIALSNLSTKLQAGEYQIPQNLNLKEVVDFLQHGTFEEKLTFIEGWRREEMAEAINSKFEIRNLKLDGTEFLRETEGLEGYLFPDTYFVSTETTAEELVKMMRENFEKKVGEQQSSDLTLDEVVNIASIVEREVRLPEDKAIVTGILIKRYLNDWPLQADATIQYALGYQEGGLSPEASGEGGWWKKNLTKEDTEVESPYNTYKYPGLPPTPICNPGLESLNAVINPVASDYWYYVSDSDGKMHFSVTNEEHNENVAKYVR